MLAPTVHHTSPLRLAPMPKPRLLLVGDSAERLRSLQAGINRNEFEITPVCSLEELRDACREHHDLAAIDVGPAQIAPMLKILRTSAEHAEIPLLVESARLYNDHSLAGVLPSYRAMPCSRTDMLTLMRGHRETLSSSSSSGDYLAHESSRML